jgi:hypothetical protein
MLWQQALASSRKEQARRMAQRGVKDLLRLDRDFNAYWPARNKGTPSKCSAFLRWRVDDYRRGVLHFPPHVAKPAKPKPYAAR